MQTTQFRTEHHRSGVPWPVDLLSTFNAFVIAGLVCGTGEWLLYTTPLTGTGLFSVLAFYLPFSLVAGVVLVLPVTFCLRWAQRVFAGLFYGGDGDRAVWSWRGAFFLLSLASLPLPLNLLSGAMAARITDAEQMVLFGAAAGILTLAVAIVSAAAFAWFAAWLLMRLPGFEQPISFGLFWTFCFPVPWLVVPMLVIASEGDSLSSAAVLLLPLLCVVLTPPFRPLFRGFSPLLSAALAALLTVVVLAIFSLAAAGMGFDKGSVLQAPFSSRIFAWIHDKVDSDSDGYSSLFDGLDCDDSDANVHRMAHDRPGNGLDEDCDGEDATQGGDIIYGNRAPFPVDSARKHNVLLVLVDALRADHLAFNGYKRNTAPNIERLAAESLNFTRAYAQYPSTGISVPSMFSGVYPEYMKWGRPRGAKDFLIHKDNRLLPDVLSKAGYVTGGILVPWISNNVRGLKSRFDIHLPLYPPKQWRRYVENSSPVSTTRAIEFFERAPEGKPFFLFVHMEEPHRPYVNHDPPGVVFGKKAADRYDSDVHWADLWLGFLLGYMNEKGLLKDTIVIILADHGEEFREHGKRHHGHQLYQESIWVPLIISYPGVKQQTVETPVGLVDLFPTVLDLTGIDHPREALQGQSLLRTAAEPEGTVQRPIFTMLADRTVKPTRHLKGVIMGNDKLIWDMTSDTEELFDLAADPRERKNLVRQKPAVARKLRTVLQDFLAHSEPSWKQY